MDFSTKLDIEMELAGIETKDVVEIKGTNETPHVTLKKIDGKIRFGGRSLPENPREFYAPIKNWLAVYAENPAEQTTVTFIYDYFNTASSKIIMEMIDILKTIKDRGHHLRIDWHYIEDDEDMLEAGEDFSEVTEVDFNYYPYD